jgi:protocatechuate 3,4-dioxygenase beta subunit
MLTSRGDSSRSNANTSETLLTPANVNKAGFGRLFSFPVDYIVMAQPLYVPNVNIPGQGTHNVVYVVTQADSVYAIDADSGTQLWYASMLNGGTTASGTYLPCGSGPGFAQEGIVGTPVIDNNTGTMYLVAKTVLNGTVRHHIHALDITTGSEQPGSPVLIQAQSTSNAGHVTVFKSLHQKNRPGLLLLNNVLYIGFGSNYCNDGNSGWILSYDPSSLSQLKVFNTSPDWGLTSIWQAGVGLTADEAGNIYAETAESTNVHGFDVPTGGQTYCNSVIKLAPDLSIMDYFTPWNVAFLNQHDFDLSSTGAVALPDQPGAYPHELIASGKQGIVYVLDRDNLGMYAPSDNVIQEVSLIPGSTQSIMFGSPAYWNNTVYFAADGAPIQAFPVVNGLLGTPLKIGKYVGSHSPSISANGNTDGVLWVISGPQLYAFNATTMQLIYTTGQAANGRDSLPPIGHFVTQTVANGRVYVGTKASLEAYGLFNVAAFASGGGQSAPVGQTLAAPLQVHAANPYTGQPDVGVTVSFSDGCKIIGGSTCGTFTPTTAVTDSNGNASTSYTVPKTAGTYTLTSTGTGFGSASTTAIAAAGSAVRITSSGGAKQTAAAGSTLPIAIAVKAQDANNNGVPGVTVNFTANNKGVLTPVSAVTDATGIARTSLQLPTTVSTVTVTAFSSGLTSKPTFLEYSVAGPAANIAITNGNGQSGSVGTPLSQALAVSITDQYGNPVPGTAVAFSDGGAGGSFASANPENTDSSGAASQVYTLPINPGSVSISATVSGINNPVVFTETAN